LLVLHRAGLGLPKLDMKICNLMWCSSYKQKGIKGFDLFVDVAEAYDDKCDNINIYLNGARYLAMDVLFVEDGKMAGYAKKGFTRLLEDLWGLAKIGYVVASLSLDTIVIPAKADDRWKVLPFSVMKLDCLT
jgi:hypothetical protein